MSDKLSIVIRNRNEAVHLEKVLQALSLQAERNCELIVVDNESDDNSVEVARRFNARVISIDKRSFSYGRALNLGLREATGNICVILSAHSLPVGTSFLTECVKPFSDVRVAATRCVYVGKRADLLRWMQPELLDISSDVGVVISKGPLASGCAIRRSVWEKIPFDEEVAAAEEKLWAVRVVQAGHLIHSPCAAFYYYLKALSPSAQLRKNYREIMEIHNSTGMTIGFVGSPALKSLSRFVTGLCYGAPRAAFGVASHEILRIYLRLSFHVRSKARPSTGSIN